MKHGLTDTRLYRIFQNMKQRYYNPNDPKYGSYGGKGVTIFQGWLDDFQTFYNWAMENGYADDLTIDRINSKKGYAPENCRWITMKENRERARNGRSTDNPKSYRESFRLSETDMKKIEFCMKKTGMSKTDVIRMGIDEVYQKTKK